MDDAECGTHLLGQGGRRPATSEQTDPRFRFRFRQSEGHCVPKRWPNRLGVSTPGLVAEASRGPGADRRPRPREHNSPERVRTSEGGGMEATEMEVEGRRARGKPQRQEGREPPRRELPPPVGCSGGCHRRVRVVGLLGRAQFGASLLQAVVGSDHAHLRAREAMLFLRSFALSIVFLDEYHI